MTKKTIVYGSFDEPINIIIARSGIVTNGNTWTYNSVTINRPNGLNWRKPNQKGF